MFARSIFSGVVLQREYIPWGCKDRVVRAERKLVVGWGTWLGFGGLLGVVKIGNERLQKRTLRSVTYSQEIWMACDLYECHMHVGEESKEA